MFYEGLRLWGGSGSYGAVQVGGSAEEDPHVRGGRGGGAAGELDSLNVSRILVPGG